MQAPATSVASSEAFLELAGCDSAFGGAVAALRYRSLGKALHYWANELIAKAALGVANSAVIFAQRHAQGVMQSAFDDAVAAVEPQEAFGANAPSSWRMKRTYSANTLVIASRVEKGHPEARLMPTDAGITRATPPHQVSAR